MLALPLRCSRAPLLHISRSLQLNLHSPVLSALRGNIHRRGMHTTRVCGVTLSMARCQQKEADAKAQDNTLNAESATVMKKSPAVEERLPSKEEAESVTMMKEVPEVEPLTKNVTKEPEAEKETTTETPPLKPVSDKEEKFEEKVARPGCIRQILFTFAGLLVIFPVASFLTSWDTKAWSDKLKIAGGPHRIFSSKDLEKAKFLDMVTSLRAFHTRINELKVHQIIKGPLSWSFVKVFQTYVDVSEGKRAMWKLCIATLITWAVFTKPRFSRLYGHDPLKGKSVTILTSVFGQDKFWQVLIGLFVLEGIGGSAYRILKLEQQKEHPGMLESTTVYHFIAFFLGAGMFSTLVSHIASTKLIYPRMIRTLINSRNQPRIETWRQALNASKPKVATVNEASATIKPIYGMSGALYACVVLTMLAFPDSQVSLFIPPRQAVDLEIVTWMAIMFDVAGVLCGWTLVNHWAHLGGAVFGWAYYRFGSEAWYKARRMWSGIFGV